MGKHEAKNSGKKTRKKVESKDPPRPHEIQALADWGAPEPDPEKLRETARILKQLVS